MAVSVETFREDELLKRDIQPPAYPSAEQNALRTRIRALVGFWEKLNGSDASEVKPASGIAPRDIFRPYGSGVPPTYEESVLDQPPDYTSTDAFASAQWLGDSSVTASIKVEIERDYRQEVCEALKAYVDKLDLNSTEHIRSHANKKAKKAAKQQQMSKWADSDNEDKKAGEDGAAGDDNGGGGDAGGAGGDAPGGNGGDDGDEWDSGKKGKKDKKKK